jgi:hypothetical protein
VVVVVEGGTVVVVVEVLVVVVVAGTVVVVVEVLVVVVVAGTVVVVADVTVAGGAVVGLVPTRGAASPGVGMDGAAAGTVAGVTRAFGTAIGDFKTGQGFVLPSQVRAMVVAAVGAEGLDECKLIAKSAARPASPVPIANCQWGLSRGQRIGRWGES